MPCYTPNIRLANLIPSEETGKTQTIKFYNAKQHLNYEWFDKQNEFFKAHNIMQEYQRVPCGWCVGCQEKYSKDWAIRCVKEAELYPNNYFITLTYDDEHLPINGVTEDFEIFSKETGEIAETNYNGSLRESDLTTFLKKLRRHYEYHYNHTGIRFFACGEYGPTTQRPHYHAILFNMPINLTELKILRVTEDNNFLYECKELEELWGKGFITLAEVNWDTCAYVARYVMKKQRGKVPEEYYLENGQNKEFIRMSRMPGIGKDFASTEVLNKIYENDEMIVKGHRENISIAKPPSYYDRIYDAINPTQMQKIKDQRKAIAIEGEKILSLQSSYDTATRLKVAEAEKTRKWNSLSRDNIK